MAIPHAQPGEVIDVRPLADTLASSETRTLVKTPHIEVIRIVLRAGKVIADHKAPGEITVQCLEGRMIFRTMGQERSFGKETCCIFRPRKCIPWKLSRTRRFY